MFHVTEHPCPAASRPEKDGEEKPGGAVSGMWLRHHKTSALLWAGHGTTETVVMPEAVSITHSQAEVRTHPQCRGN